jgi:CelD/BcsL family acetyltransferase involved in cellulose biosynthesis
MEQVRHNKLEISGPVSEVAALCRDQVSANMAFQIVSSDQDILTLEKEWRDLEMNCPNTVLFQSFDWCRNHLSFSRTLIQGDDRFRPVVITIRQGQKLVALLPLCLQRKNRMTVLTGFSEPFQQYTEILLSGDIDAISVRQTLLDALKSTGADYFHFGQVRHEGMLAKLFDGIVLPTGELDAAPYVVLKDFENYEEYLKTVRSKTRKNLRNARNRLERDGEVTHHLTRSGPMMGEVVTRTFEGREAWLERMGITSRAFRDDDFKAFLNRFSNSHVAKGVETLAMSLKQGEKSVSDQWGFVYRGRYYAFMATWNPEFEAVSPGRLHLGEVIKTCFDEGFETADFMIPASSYKLTWTDHVAPVSDYVLAISTRGKIYTKLWLDLARPLSKRLFFKLPASVRGLLVKQVLPSVE